MGVGFHAFTIKYHGRTNVLATEIGVSSAYDPEKSGIKDPDVKIRAVWDTGASMSTITTDLVRSLGLKPIGKTRVRNTSGENVKDTFFINVYLPNKVVLSLVKVVECDSISGDFKMLVGMDIIGAGDFAVTNQDGKTTMSYRIPSIETIDYVEIAKKLQFNKTFVSRPIINPGANTGAETAEYRHKINSIRKKEKRRKKLVKRQRQKNRK